MATTRLTLHDTGRHLTLAVGDRLVVQLDESPTSGYTCRNSASSTSAGSISRSAPNEPSLAAPATSKRVSSRNAASAETHTSAEANRP